MRKELLTIREAAGFLDVSVDTLRRWDKIGKLVAIRKNGGTHRYYQKEDLEMFSSDLMKLGANWAVLGKKISEDFYCPDRDIFQARLLKMQEELLSSGRDTGFVSFIGSIVGEIGNNSYDHNLGNWPNTPGVFFGYDIHKKVIVLADRGLGILKTLSRVRISLQTHEEALRVAFTETISGRAPENRGNGLKFVRKVISRSPIDLRFQTGDAVLNMKGGSADFSIEKSKEKIQGCLALIKF